MAFTRKLAVSDQETVRAFLGLLDDGELRAFEYAFPQTTGGPYSWVREELEAELEHRRHAKRSP